MKLSVIIPCYRSEQTIKNVVNRIIETIENDGRYQYEIICVNDGSPDDVWSVISDIANKGMVKAINLSRNFGQHAALMAGFNYADGDIIICMDDDGQTPPEKMFLLIDKLENGYDVVSAKYSNKNRGLVRELGSRISFAMSKHLIGMPKNIELNSFFVFRSYVKDEIIKYKGSYPFVHGLILRVTRNIANVEMERGDRIEGSSGYSMQALIKLFLNGFTAFSEKPLRLTTIVGFCFSTIGFIFAAIILIQKLMFPGMQAGYASIMCVLLVVGGLIMLFLGMLGEYVGRIYIGLNNAPQYVVKEEVGKENNE